MIDHLSIAVTNYEKSKAFYLAALAPLGYDLVMEIDRERVPSLPVPKTCGLGANGKPDLWLKPAGEVTAIHLALVAPDRATVDAFHAAALAAGGKDNGAPGPRPHYHPNYYGAFVFDPDGHNVEAVCHGAAHKPHPKA